MTLGTATPILRSFDEAITKQFYFLFLGFKLDWEHRFEPGSLLYMQISRAGCVRDPSYNRLTFFENVP